MTIFISKVIGKALPINSIATLIILTISSFSVLAAPGDETPSSVAREIEASLMASPQLVPGQDQRKSNATDTSKLSKDKAYILSGVALHGATIYSRDELSKMWSALISKSVSIHQVVEISNKLSAKYRNDGYFLTAVVPKLQMNGTKISLHLNVVEGFIDQIRVEAQNEGKFTQPNRRKITKYAAPILQSHPLKIEVLERSLLIMNDMPGISVKSVIRPSRSVVGAADLVLVVDHDPIAASLSFTNRGGDDLGPIRLNGSVAFRSLMGRSEETRLQVSYIPQFGGQEGQLSYFGLSHKELIGKSGTSLTFAVSHSDNERGGDLDVFDIEGQTKSASLKLAHPFIRTRRKNLYGYIELGYTSQDGTLLGVTTIKDRVWALRSGLSYQFTGPKHSTKIGFDVAKGLNILNASEAGDENLSRTDGRPDFLLVKSNFTQVRSLGKRGLLGKFQLSGQYSPDSLLSSEEFSLGGSQFGRGYLKTQLSGDSGLAASFELSKRFNRPNSIILEPYVYFDGGKVWRHNGAGGNLHSAGLGLRYHNRKGLSLDMSLNAPLEKTVKGSSDESINLIVSGSWRF